MINDCELFVRVKDLSLDQVAMHNGNCSGDSRYSTRLSIDELHAFADQIRSLPCVIKEEQLVEEMFRKVYNLVSWRNSHNVYLGKGGMLA